MLKCENQDAMVKKEKFENRETINRDLIKSRLDIHILADDLVSLF